MAIKNLFVFLSCAAVFFFTLSVSMIVAQIATEEKPSQSDSFLPTGITGAWRFNHAESDDVLTKIGELLKGRETAPTGEKSAAKQSEPPAFSISLFAPDVLILANGDAGEMTINEIFKSVIETRTFLIDGALREYEIVPGTNLKITATRIPDGFSVENVSPRGNKRTETFRVTSGGTKLIVVVRVERLRTGEVLNLRRVYDRQQDKLSAPVKVKKPTLIIKNYENNRSSVDQVFSGNDISDVGRRQFIRFRIDCSEAERSRIFNAFFFSGRCECD